MKRSVPLLGLTFFTLSGFSQSVSELKDKNVVEILSRIDTVHFTRGNDLFITLFKVNNGSGSAGLGESHEVSHNLVVCVSEYDEYPAKKVFTVGPFIGPVISGEKEMTNGYVFEIQHGVPRTRTRIVIRGLQVFYE